MKTDGQTDRQTGRETDMKTDRQTDRQTGRQTCIYIYRERKWMRNGKRVRGSEKDAMRVKDDD